MRSQLVAVILCAPLWAFSQSWTLTGTITDADTGEALVGASVLEHRHSRGVSCNQFGFYSLTLRTDTVRVSFSYVGYQRRTFEFVLRQDTVLNVVLNPNNVLDSVTVYSERTDSPTTKLSTIEIPVHTLTTVPALLGEPDVMKTLQLLPGVKTGSEGSSGIYVRGGGADQNLILLDGVPIYNANHVYGFFSTFNPDAINHIVLIKGGFPARYGGRLSTVVDISMKEGNLFKLHGQATLGLITSRLVLEGPIVTKKASFIISARRSYLNLLRAPIVSKLIPDSGQDFYFYDFNAKVNYQVNQKNRLYLSGYSGRDYSSLVDEQTFQDSSMRFDSKAKSEQSWGNLLVSSRWNHIYSSKWFSNMTVSYTKYDFNITNENIQNIVPTNGDKIAHVYQYQYNSGVRDMTGRIDFDYLPGSRNYIRFGIGLTNHYFTPGVVTIISAEEQGVQTSSSSTTMANEITGYAEDELSFGRLRVNVGIHSALFATGGTRYPSVQPRVEATLKINAHWTAHAGYASMRQFVHLLSNSGLGLPTDLWTPTTSRISPESSQQETLGISRDLGKQFLLSVEGYYKTMNGLLEYKEGANYLSATQNWEDKVEVGQGESYGSEVFIQKKAGRLTGWFGYTLSWSVRQFDNINSGNWFPYRYDRRHDCKFTLAYKLSGRFDFSTNWVFATGNAVTIPLDIYLGAVRILTSPPMVMHYESRNGFRMANYHRLDISATYTLRTKVLVHLFNLSAYNAYNRNNPFYMQFGFTNSGKYALRQISLFPILPSFSYTIKF